jgi:hypothetical protein
MRDVSRCRPTRKDNPSERFEEEFDGVFVGAGNWGFGQRAAPRRNGGGPAFGSWDIADHTVEIEKYGSLENR